ncbi:ATP-binding cassette domain-containing protein [Microbacterium koreense]|uniref:ATP-binding cassette domain-containing protein n=1 Tax=Microbacterium koreense TaxID=323761 RepID=A0ABW2ZS10_9MICO
MTGDLGLEDVSVAFGRSTALDDITLAVPRGEVTAVVGGDGAGKSTLLRVLASRIRPTSGHVRTLPDSCLGYQPSTSGVWPNLTVTENLHFVGRSFGMPSRAIRARGDEFLERAGLTQARDRLGSQLSGGMRQKLGFLMAILHEPDLVLLDEPSTGVDPVSRVELWRLISRTAVGDTAVLMATTYLDEAQRAASVTALESGHLLASGTPAEIIDGVPGIIGRIDDAALSSSGPTDAARSWRRGTTRHIWVPADLTSSLTRGTVSAISTDLEDALIALTLRDSPVNGTSPAQVAERAPAAPADSPAERGAVQASGVDVTRRFGRHVAVDEVSLEVRAGEIIGLIGANGAGKTTFLRTLIGLDRPDGGSVELFGATPDEASRRRLGYVPQGLGLFQTLSVEQNVEFFQRVYASESAVDTLPPSLLPVKGRPVKEIGLGRQRQLAFALALAHHPELLVLDEPTSGVDPLARARLWDIIHAQADAGRAVLVTTHYLQEAEQCTRLALMSQGRLIGSGTVSDLTAGVRAVRVESAEWQRVFTTLSDAGLPTMLSGRDVRVAGADPDEVRHALGGVPATVSAVAPTLEEVMVLRESTPVTAAA